MVSVDLDESPAVVRPFALKSGATFPVLLGSGKAAPQFNIQAIPSNIVIAPNGQIVYAAEGYDEKAILNAIQKATPRAVRHHVRHRTRRYRHRS